MTSPEPWVRKWPGEPEVQCMCGHRMPQALWQALWVEHIAERHGMDGPTLAEDLADAPTVDRTEGAP